MLNASPSPHLLIDVADLPRNLIERKTHAHDHDYNITAAETGPHGALTTTTDEYVVSQSIRLSK